MKVLNTLIESSGKKVWPSISLNEIQRLDGPLPQGKRCFRCLVKVELKLRGVAKPKPFFFHTRTWLPPLGCQTSPSQGVATGQKTWKNQNKKKKIIIHTLIHTFAHIFLSAPGVMSPNRQSCFPSGYFQERMNWWCKLSRRLSSK